MEKINNLQYFCQAQQGIYTYPLLYNNFHSETLMQSSISKLTAIENCMWLQNQELFFLLWFDKQLKFQNFYRDHTPPKKLCICLDPGP